MENQSRNERFCKVKNLPKRCKGHRFHGFSVFRKSRKMEPKGYPQSHENRQKIELGAPRGRLWQLLGRFWADSKNQRLSMSLRGAPKSVRIGPWSARGPKRTLRPAPGGQWWRRWVPHWGKEGRKKRNKRDDSTRLEGRWPGELDLFWETPPHPTLLPPTLSQNLAYCYFNPVVFIFLTREWVFPFSFRLWDSFSKHFSFDFQASILVFSSHLFCLRREKSKKIHYLLK